MEVMLYDPVNNVKIICGQLVTIHIVLWQAQELANLRNLNE